MKLKAKIKNKYLKEILEGKKKEEYRQIESIILVDEQGNEYEFEVKGISLVAGLDWLRKKYPDVDWKDEYRYSTIKIELGELINKDVDEPSTAETVEILHKMYVEQNKYWGGKTLKQLVDEANDPRRWRWD